jgi:hypothetical protein
MATKAQLEARVEQLEDDLRRAGRALNQVEIDLQALPLVDDHDFLAPHSDVNVVNAIERAEAEFDRVVKDPSDRINTYIQSREGLGWSWEDDYTRNGQFAWCGAFAAFCHVRVKMDIRYKVFASCYRMYTNWAKTSRKIEIQNAAPGDIIVVFTSKHTVQGDHITICNKHPDIKNGYVETIEGNAKGELGDGEYGEGVIKRRRSLEEIAHVYRLLGVDFDE